MSICSLDCLVLFVLVYSTCFTDFVLYLKHCLIVMHYKIVPFQARHSVTPNFLLELCPLVYLSIAVMFDLNLKTAEDKFTNFGSSINHHQTVCKEQKNHICTNIFHGIMPLCNFKLAIVSTLV